MSVIPDFIDDNYFISAFIISISILTIFLLHETHIYFWITK